MLRQKGITLERASDNEITFETFERMVLDDLTLKSAKRHQLVWNEKTKDIETRYISRTVRKTIDSRRTPVGKFDTVPFGWVT